MCPYNLFLRLFYLQPNLHYSYIFQSQIKMGTPVDKCHKESFIIAHHSVDFPSFQI